MKYLSLLFLFIGLNTFAQDQSLVVKKIVLDNGFTILLNQDANAKSVFGAVVVKAGSKNDPADATGMAHYLEHLLFKGTTNLGTIDYEKEKPFMDSIIFYYDLLGKISDEEERNKIQKLINNQSLEQAKYGKPTEFDKLIKCIGGTNLNAFTQNDMTVYHNEFPGNQINKWLELYSNRFQNPVFRSFQSELEVVYEEKNRGMDSPFSKVFEELNGQLFKTHPYGTQSTIGTTEHLKSPSLTKMYEYFNTYYVANNMALVLSGNFNMEKTIPIIIEKFSKLRSAPIPVFPNYVNSTFDKKEVIEVSYTPIKVGLLGYKTYEKGNKDEIAFDICSSLLQNESETGILNKLALNGDIMQAGKFALTYNDDGALIIFYIPKLVGQSFNEAEELVLNAIDKIKKGDFSENDLTIIKQEISRQRQQGLESVENRALNLAQIFSEGSTWEAYLSQVEEIEKITKEDIIRVANKYFIENYLVYRSSMGFPKKEKMQKPGYQAVIAKQTEDSDYAKNFIASITPNDSPRILDYNKDANMVQVNASTKLYTTLNPTNDIFSLTFEKMIGKDSIRNLDIASSLFNQFYTKDFTRDQLKEQFALLGISYYANASDARFTIVFTGLEKNLEKSLPLMKAVMYDPMIDEKSIETIKEGMLSDRKSEEKEPSAMGRMLLDYARFGEDSENLTRLTEKQIKGMKSQNILADYKKIFAYNTNIHFVGKTPAEQIDSMLFNVFPNENTNRKVALTDKKTKAIVKDIVYLINDKNAVQSQVYFLINTPNFSGNTADKVHAEAFNQYLSDGFSGILMQEIREYRSLAYSTGGSFVNPIEKNKPGAFYAYIGCQADKTNDAVAVLDSILNYMPEKPERIDMIKSGMINSISSNFPAFRNISTSIELGKQLGYTQSPLVEEYKLYKTLTFDDITNFYQPNIQKQPRVITIYGDLKKIDLKKLANYGRIIELKLKDIKTN